MSDEGQQSLQPETRLQMSSDPSHLTTESAAASSHTPTSSDDLVTDESEIVPIITRQDSVDLR